jgi:hypothetical protein
MLLPSGTQRGALISDWSDLDRLHPALAAGSLDINNQRARCVPTADGKEHDIEVMYVIMSCVLIHMTSHYRLMKTQWRGLETCSPQRRPKELCFVHPVVTAPESRLTQSHICWSRRRRRRPHVLADRVSLAIAVEKDVTVVFNELAGIVVVPECLERRLCASSIVFAEELAQMRRSKLSVVPWHSCRDFNQISREQGEKVNAHSGRSDERRGSAQRRARKSALATRGSVGPSLRPRREQRSNLGRGNEADWGPCDEDT